MVKLRQIVATGRETKRVDAGGLGQGGGRKEVVLCARGDSTVVPKVYLHLHSVIKLPYPSSSSSFSSPRPRFRDTRLPSELSFLSEFVEEEQLVGPRNAKWLFRAPGHVTEL